MGSNLLSSHEPTNSQHEGECKLAIFICHSTTFKASKCFTQCHFWGREFFLTINIRKAQLHIRVCIRNDPSRHRQAPSSYATASVKLRQGSVKAPSSCVKVPSSSVKAPSSSVKAPSSCVKAPSRLRQAPSGLRQGSVRLRQGSVAWRLALCP